MTPEEYKEYEGMKSPLKKTTLLVGMFILALLAVMYLAGLAYGSPLDCESIRNPDERHMCRAVSKNDKAECEFIKNADTRALCRARVSR